MFKKCSFYPNKLQSTDGNEITKAINKLNEAITLKLEIKDEIIKSLKSLKFHRYRTVSVSVKVKSAYSLINNQIEINNLDQYSKWNNIVIQGIPQSVKSKDLEDQVINVLDKVNVKVTKNGIKVCRRLGDSRKTIRRFVSGKHSLEELKNKKMLMSVDLTRIRLDKNTNLFLSQNLSSYNNKIAFHCRELSQKRLIDSTCVYGGKVFIRIQDNSNKEEIKNLCHLTKKLPDHICNLND